jgi:hypothetical protein
VIATVSDGLAQAQSTMIVTVVAPPAARSVPPAPSNPGPAGALTATAIAYGSELALAYPRACVRAGSQLTVTMNIKRRAHAGKVVTRVVKVTFAIGAKTVKTLRAAPFRARLTIAHASALASTVRVRATAYLMVRGAGHRTKSLTIPIRVC